MQLEVTEKSPICADIVRLRLADPAGGALPGFTPGAHIELELGGLSRRYSLTGPRDMAPAPRYYEICVLRTEPSRGGSAYIHDRLAVGEQVEAGGPFNEFDLHSNDRPAVFIAGGIGITPFLPMMAALDQRGAAYELHYGARSAERLVPLPRLNGWLARYVGSQRGGAIPVPDILAQAPAGAYLYVCGPGTLIAAVWSEAMVRGWPAVRVRFESFGPQQKAADGPVTIHLALSETTLTVPPGTPILDALLDHGIWAPFECRRGECASCCTEVLAGKPDHRDLCLTPDQRQNQMCTCISWAQTEALTLNL